MDRNAVITDIYARLIVNRTHGTHEACALEAIAAADVLLAALEVESPAPVPVATNGKKNAAK